MDVKILGTRGIPASHGGFETFAEDLAIYLTERGHRVTVYCQTAKPLESHEDMWNGIHRVHICSRPGALGTIAFDFAAVLHSLRCPGVNLVLGYNTAVFSVLYILRRRVCLTNMDGIEWKRKKWTYLQRIWLRLNEYAGAKVSTHLIADHPEIAHHLEQHVPSKKITMIPYGADPASDADLDQHSYESLKTLGLVPDRYAIIIARPEPENSLLEIVQAFSAKDRGIKLVVLGKFEPDDNHYHKQVLTAAAPTVLFPGAIYDRKLVKALRLCARVYVHGHCVGGTNPSLVEAMAAGSAIIAHDNIFTRWVTGPGAVYFSDATGLSSIFDSLLSDNERLSSLRQSSRRRYLEGFTQDAILGKYEALIQSFSGERWSGKLSSEDPALSCTAGNPVTSRTNRK
jgi:glycosyltransferase involved in cell wall biosynthesis